MTAPAQPQAAGNGTTAVAATQDPAAVPPVRTPEDRAESKTALAIGNLPENVKQALTLARQQNLVRAEIAATNWGKGLDRETRYRISEWAHSVGIDPATELDVLGGRFYKNAWYYLRRLSEMEQSGLIEYAYIDHIEIDPRLDAMAARTDNAEIATAARTEIERRLWRRIEYRAPDAAEAISVFHLKLRTTPHEFSACKWCGGNTKRNDPVGNEHPVETSETRSIRRTMRLIASSSPEFRPMIERNDDDHIDEEIGPALRAGLLRAKTAAQKDAEKEAARYFDSKGEPRALMATSGGLVVPVEMDSNDLAKVAPETIARGATMPDAYADENQPRVRGEPTSGTVETIEAPTRTAPPVEPAADEFQDDTSLLSPAERRELEAKKGK